ncbi:MAG TPA: DUF2125 domain-containing protein [Stellaceae bacterium]|nr:DUF2125 domain-containing protein [Stellaceae bacterium]
MRRSTRLGLAAAVLVLAGLGGYTAFWWMTAGRIAEGVRHWAQSLPAQDLHLSWRTITVKGFPFSFRVELREAQLRGRTGAPGGEVSVKLLTGSARPWNFRVWRLTAPEGLTATASPIGQPAASLTAPQASGSVTIDDGGGAALWLGLDAPVAKMGLGLTARQANFWLSLPAHAPQTHSERAFGMALQLLGLTLPIVPAPFHNPLDEVSFGVTMRGAVPAEPLRRAAMAWRDAGGTLDLDHLTLHWGDLRITGSGTLALDAELQPVGGFSGAIGGYPQLMTALVAAGRMRAGDARLAGLALALMSRTGPDGRPEIATSFTIQDGQMYLGPAKLGPVPRIPWK